MEGQVNAQEEEKKEEVKVEESKDKKRSARKKKVVEGAEAAKEDDLVNIYYFNEPTRVEDLWSDEDPEKQKKIVAVYAAGNYNYALERKEGNK